LYDLIRGSGMCSDSYKNSTIVATKNNLLDNVGWENLKTLVTSKSYSNSIFEFFVNRMKESDKIPKEKNLDLAITGQNGPMGKYTNLITFKV